MATSTTPRSERGQTGGGPRFHVNIEGTVFDWVEDTISVPQIRTLGGLPTDVAVEEIDLNTNKQRTLSETDVVELRPGLGFAKKIKFQRG